MKAYTAAKEFSRTTRYEKAIQRCLATLLLKEARDPRLKFVSITRVNVSKDLSSARIYVSSMQLGETPADPAVLVKVLDAAKGYFSTTIAKELQMRITPELHFVYDPTLEWMAYA